MGGDKKLLESFLEKEGVFLDRFLVKHARNYYAWTYKKFLVDEVIMAFKLEEWLVKTQIDLKDFCNRNVHDYSAFHLLQHVYKCLGEKIKIEGEFAWIVDLIEKYDLMYQSEKADPTNIKVRYYELEAARKHLKFVEHLMKK
jgi:hypothetical protein